MAKDSREKIAKRRQRRRRRRLKPSVKIALIVLILLICAGIYAAYSYYQYKHTPDPHGMISELQGGTKPPNTYDVTDDVMADAKYWILDVGEGEAIYVKSGTTDILIDTGSAKDGKAVIDAISSEISGDLEYLIITSLSYRRIGGFAAICEEFCPVNIITCDLGSMKSELTDAAGETKLQEGKDTTLTLSQNSTFTIFKPEVSSKDPYDQSLMTYFKYGSNSFFAESDAGEEEESRVVGRIANCNVAVLARAGSDEVNQHIGELGSGYYIVSAKSGEGLPSKKMLAAVRNMYATYKSGTIKFTTNGKDVTTDLDRNSVLDADELYPEKPEESTEESGDETETEDSGEGQ